MPRQVTKTDVQRKFCRNIRITGISELESIEHLEEDGTNSNEQKNESEIAQVQLLPRPSIVGKADLSMLHLKAWQPAGFTNS
jgi:hypothetical protein